MKRFGLLAAVLPLFVSGCFFDQFRTVSRSQLDDTEAEREAVKTIGVISQYDNAAEAQVSGYGIVTGLAGTGGSTPAGDARTAVAERLKRDHPDENVSDVIDSPNSAIVIVSAIVKSGVRRDELVDVEVTLPPGSRAKSLRGGILSPTPLMTFSTQGDVRDYLKSKG